MQALRRTGQSMSLARHERHNRRIACPAVSQPQSSMSSSWLHDLTKRKEACSVVRLKEVEITENNSRSSSARKSLRLTWVNATRCWWSISDDFYHQHNSIIHGYKVYTKLNLFKLISSTSFSFGAYVTAGTHGTNFGQFGRNPWPAGLAQFVRSGTVANTAQLSPAEKHIAKQS